MSRAGHSEMGKNPKNKTKLDIYNVFQVEEESAQELRHRRLDDVESSEYHVETIDSEDDEEIDSDEAFDEEDDERYSHYKFKSDKAEISDDESELEEDGIDLSEMLNPHKSNRLELDSDVESVSEDEFSDPVDLADIVDRLDAPTLPKSKPKKPLEKTEVYQESEFNVPESRQSDGKLDLNDMVGILPDALGVKSAVEILKKGGKRGKFKEPVAAPLPKRIQDRFDRKVAYQAVSEEVSKWEPTVMKNREADHLHFAAAPPKTEISSGALAGSFQPANSLESSVSNILKESNLAEKDIKQDELQQVQKMSKKEAARRFAELRRNKELLYREEMKARRIGKIKSKTFRKIRKKEKQKFLISKMAQEILDPEEAQRQIEKAQMDRAVERMTLKHKNTGKWAKEMLKHGKRDPEARQAVMEQLRQHDSLKRKIDDIESGDDVSSEDEMDVEAALEELDKMKEEKGEMPKKGLYAMKFMQDAMKREEADRQKLIEDTKNELLGIQKSEDNTNGAGRMTFGPNSTNSLETTNQEPPTSSKNENDTRKSKKAKKILSKADINEEQADNPWLERAEKPDKKAAKTEIIDTDIKIKPVVMKEGFEQLELVQQAFAEDDIVEIEMQEDEGEEDEAKQTKKLGWGSWSGAGISSKKKPKEEPPKKERKNVIVKDKRNKNYLVQKVPYPYQSRKEYENSIAVPLGREWNTQASFQKLNTPRVTTGMGAIISPLQK